MQPRVPELALGPRYQIVDTIASGGMGTVYLGRITGPGSSRPVAVKVLHPHLAQDPENVALFLDEARIATRLHHPNVVDVIDVDMVGDELVIVMPYIEGLPLSRLSRVLKEKGRPLPIPIALRILHDSLQGLHAAHELRDERGVELSLVHRDVTPHNLLVGTDGSTRVSDFGVATSVGRLAHTHTHGGVRGKLQYLAPEQVFRRPLDRRVDLFAAGIVLWQCLTGRTLFDGGTEAETLAMILRDPIQPPSTTRSEIPLDLDELCMKALERDPARRFASGAVFADAIANLTTVRMASPGDVGRLVEELARETVERHRELLRAAEAGGPRLLGRTPGDPPAVAGPESQREAAPISTRRSSLQLFGVALVSVVVGGSVVHFASPGSPAPPLEPPTQVTSITSATPADSAEPAQEPEPATTAAPLSHAVLELPSDPAPARATSRPRPRARATEEADAGHARPAATTAKTAHPFMPNGL